MPEKRIVIAGGGFAGTAALRHIYYFNRFLFKDYSVILVDKKDNFEFLPMLPDVIGGWCGPGSVSADLGGIARKCGAMFVKDEIAGLDIPGKKIELRSGRLDYEYLLIATGSETDFFGRDDLSGCSKLDSVSDAAAINKRLRERAGCGGMVNVVIIGAGYTGIELATNADLFLNAGTANYKIYIVEKGGDILGMLPGWIRREVRDELERMNIEVVLNDSLDGYDGEQARFSSGREIEDAFCVWSAGVKTPGYLEGAPLEKENTRIRVNEDLTPSGKRAEGVYAAGDAAYFYDRKNARALRMAVMFSLAEGKTAAANIANSAAGKPAVRYKPVDLGYLIPMAGGKAPGIVMGARVHGHAGYLMHYLMCLYRSERVNRALIARDLAAKPRTITPKKGRRRK